jgi:tape measure domain-containing protein
MTSNRERLELIVDDGGSVEALEQKIYQSAQNSRSSFTDTMSTVAKLGLQAGKAFSGNDEMIKFTELLNKNFVVGGASATEQASAMYQLTQAMSSGRLQGDEYRSIIENAPLLAKSIEDYMVNVRGATGTMKEWASEGLLTADVIKNAMFSSSEEVEERFAKMPKTWSQIWTGMKNRAVKALDPVLRKINEVLNSKKFQDFANKAMDAFTIMTNAMMKIFDVAGKIYDFISNNWKYIAPIIGGIVAALLIYKGVTLTIMAVEGIAAIAKGVLGAATMLATGATFAQTAAQYELNAAIWACPVTWIIAAIIILIVLFVMFTEQIVGAIWWLGALFKNIGLWIANLGLAICAVIKNIGLWFGNLGLAAWSVIKNIGLWFGNLGVAIWNVIKNIGVWFQNLGSAVWAIIQNVGAWFGNLGMGIWEVLKACASNVATAFKNGWINIQIGFWSMVNAIMQGIKKVADLANKTLGWMGVNIDTSGLDFAANKIDELNSKKEEYTSIADAWAEGNSTFAYKDVGDAFNSHAYNDVGMDTFAYDDVNMSHFGYDSVGDAFGTFDTFQSGWGSEAYGAGAEIGAGIHDWISDNLSINGIMEKLGLGGTGDPNETTEGLLGDIAADTSGIAGGLSDSKDISDEQLTYLRDIAEREAINRFTTAEIKIDMTGMTNRIDGQLDIDGVVSQLTEGFIESLSTAAPGVGL